MTCPNCQIAYDPDHWESCPHCGSGEEPAPALAGVSGVLRTSTILISTGNDTPEIYRSVEDVPEPLRRMLVKSTNGLNSGTIYIADRLGREQMARAMRSLPNSTGVPLFSRSPAALPPQQVKNKRRRISFSALWFAFVAAGFTGGVIWLAGSRPW